MKQRNALIAGAAILTLTGGFFLKDSLLSTDKFDLIYYNKYVMANKVDNPVPGGAYAYYLSLRKFEREALCRQNPLETERKNEGYEGNNRFGVSYNRAVEVAVSFLNANVSDWLKVDGASRTWQLSKEVRTVRGRFDDDCVKQILKILNDEDARVFIVETVFFSVPETVDAGEESTSKAVMVSFKPKSMVINGCDDMGNCQNRESVESLMRPNWATKFKASYIDFQ